MQIAECAGKRAEDMSSKSYGDDLRHGVHVDLELVKVPKIAVLHVQASEVRGYATLSKGADVVVGKRSLDLHLEQPVIRVGVVVVRLAKRFADQELVVMLALHDRDSLVIDARIFVRVHPMDDHVPIVGSLKGDLTPHIDVVSRESSTAVGMVE
jgi:hypothetical protein